MAFLMTFPGCLNFETATGRYYSFYSKDVSIIFNIWQYLVNVVLTIIYLIDFGLMNFIVNHLVRFV